MLICRPSLPKRVRLQVLRARITYPSKAFRTKRILVRPSPVAQTMLIAWQAKASKASKPIPAWFRLKGEGKLGYNSKSSHLPPTSLMPRISKKTPLEKD
jgi:hypothetical protein